MRSITALLLIVMFLPLSVNMASAQSDPLQFPTDSYTESTATVKTSGGSVEVTYRLYEKIAYVANPVDVNYQSMNVKVPVKIDGKDIDATAAPILLYIPVGGYMSASVSGGGPGGRPGGAPGGGPGGSSASASSISGVSDLALAAGYVVVQPGVRGRDNQAADGTYFGKAPAAIIDLKSVVRYIRHNDATMPGNAEWIVSRGTSAGGALSALLGASGNSDEYAAYFAEVGAADAKDNIFASADYCPITDLEHADMSYEWEFGTALRNGQPVDQTVSQLFAAAFPDYLASLNLEGADGFGKITADNYQEYLLKMYLVPAANKYLLALAEQARTDYLAKNPWITWANDTASFSFADYVTHIGRKKGVPAFDAFDLSTAENILFGNKTTNARNFTNVGLQQSSGNAAATIDAEVQTLVGLMNPMNFIAKGTTDAAQHWWIRHGSSDSDTALTVITNLAISLENAGKNVNALLYWDAGHGADEDPEAFIAWIGEITGYNQ